MFENGRKTIILPFFSIWNTEWDAWIFVINFITPLSMVLSIVLWVQGLEEYTSTSKKFQYEAKTLLYNENKYLHTIYILKNKAQLHWVGVGEGVVREAERRTHTILQRWSSNNTTQGNVAFVTWIIELPLHGGLSISHDHVLCPYN